MIIFFVGNTQKFTFGNQLIFYNSFRNLGHHVFLADVNNIDIVDGDVIANGNYLNETVEEGIIYDEIQESVKIRDAKFSWLLEHPHPSMEKDIFQILWVANRQCKFVNDIVTMFFCNNKNVLSEIFPNNYIKGTIVTSNHSQLQKLALPDKKWVVKPSNEGNGQEVFVLNPNDTNRNVILHAITGNAPLRYETYKRELIGLQGRVAVCQPYLAAATQEERRLIFLGGELIGWYGTVKNPDDHRANRIHGTEKVLVDLTDQEIDMANIIGTSLQKLGVNYCAIDYADRCVLEANMVTPGGIQVLSRIQGPEIVEKAAQKILTLML